MLLDPVTQVGIGVFMPVCVRSCQFMMDILGNREWCQGQEKENQA